MNDIIYLPWKTRRRFNSYTDYIKARFGERVQKLTIDAGFTCPNRDGTKGRGGCSYCNNDAFNPSYCKPEKPVIQQVEDGINFHKKRYRKAKQYFVYFQAYSNTYAPVDILRKIYSEALEHEDVIGIVIGTRPDCLDGEILDYLSELNESTWLTVEFGIESCYDRTLERINRGHSFRDTQNAINACFNRGIRTGGHMIIGLPGESREEILHEAEVLSELPVNQLKFHQLQVVKGSKMGEDYKKDPGKFSEYTIDDYLFLMMEFLERLNPAIVIERIAGETMPDFNLNPSWGLRYDQVLNKFEQLLRQNDSWQGKKYTAKLEQ